MTPPNRPIASGQVRTRPAGQQQSPTPIAIAARPPLVEILRILIDGEAPPLVEIGRIVIDAEAPPLVEIGRVVIDAEAPPLVEILRVVIDAA